MLGVTTGVQRVIPLILVRIAALSATGCSAVRTGVIHQAAAVGPSASEPPYEATPQDFAEIEKLLARRAKAIERGDRRAFLATLDPGNAFLRKSQLDLFWNLQALPLSSISYRSGDFAADDAADIGDAPEVRPDVEESVQLAGVDRRPVGNDLEMTFVRRSGRWLVGNERDTGELGASGTRPWYGVRIAVVQRGELVVIADQSNAALLDELASRAEFHLGDLAIRLAVPGRRAVLIDATSTGVPTALNSEGSEAAAIAYSVATPNGQQVAGWRIKINPTQVKRLVDNDWLLRHELVHFLAKDFIDAAPLWVREGLAEYAGLLPYSLDDLEWPTRTARRLRNAKIVIPQSGTWHADPSLSYPIAHAAMTVLGNARGMAGIRELIRTYKTVQGNVGKLDTQPDWATPEVLRRVYGFGVPELTKRTRALILESVPAR